MEKLELYALDTQENIKFLNILIAPQMPILDNVTL